jgi:hypothetical protein
MKTESCESCSNMEKRLRNEIVDASKVMLSSAEKNVQQPLSARIQILETKLRSKEETEQNDRDQFEKLQLDVDKQYVALTDRTSFTWFLRENCVYLVILAFMIVFH